MFERILIANRGEIACRVARTARRMGIRTVAVYSDADVGAMHVAACDQARRLGPPSPRESYLNGEAIIHAARATGAQAIHPGYGFLSENAAFAEAVAAAGLTFIGPTPDAIRAMGSKSESKSIMGRAGVPLVPGYHGKDQSDGLLAHEAELLGFPVLIKASAGGGGKGMRIVERRNEFATALASARREAQSGFGDDTVLLERYLTEPRHIEMQVFADTRGNCVHLFERDCSVQRRHQKVLEEAPAPGMTSERRQEMGGAAVAAAKAIGYVGAGTVEFIVDRGGTFYFMEMNTRLQVEHPVTEMITGLDLVEWQLRIAAGEALPLAQGRIQTRGHAIEARIYAEDPERGFLPSIGRIAHLQAPTPSAEVRIDTGVQRGDEISQYYDPMIAKLITWGEDRATALRRLRAALDEYQVVGVTTNVDFLRRLLLHTAFAEARLDTGMVANNHAALFPPRAAPSVEVLANAALCEWLALRGAAQVAAGASSDPHSPWQEVDAWWLNCSDHALALTYATDDAQYPVRVQVEGGRFIVDIGERRSWAMIHRQDDAWVMTIDGARLVGSVVALGDARYVFSATDMVRLRLVDPLAHAAGELDSDGGQLMAPMSGSIIAVLVSVGDAIARGAPLLILEAMKMEHTIAASGAGTVTKVHYQRGDQVREGAVLIEIAASAPPAA
jgi:3-methylcrotonyl-CoA carboxylase alpha subunit